MEKFSEWVTFKPNLKHAVHNWFYYKEGFSKELVEWVIKKFKIKGTIYDPFCGVGTTLLTAKERNLFSIGIDVMPLAVFVSEVKTRNYELGKLKRLFEEIKKTRFESASKVPKEFKKYFHAENLRKIIAIMKSLEKFEEKEQNFFKLALIKASMKVALVEKHGRSLKRVKKPFIPVRRLFLNEAKKMLKDLEKVKLPKIEPLVIEADAREFAASDASAIITSPPYAMKEEYTKAYKLEHGLFFNCKTTKLQRYIGDKAKNEEEKLEIYFNDLEKSFKNMYESLKQKGIAVIVLAGFCSKKGPVNVDNRVIEIACSAGFTLERNILARLVPCKDKSRLLGKFRENIFVFRK